MREFVRPVASALSVACLAASMAILSGTGALAQAKQAPPKQMAPPPAKQAASPPAQEVALKQVALTEKQIEGVLAAQKDMDAITGKLPENAKPDAKIIARLDFQPTWARADGAMNGPPDNYQDYADFVSAFVGWKLRIRI